MFINYHQLSTVVICVAVSYVYIDEEDVLNLGIKGFRMERSHLMSRLKGKKNELRKKEDLSVGHDFKIALVERQIAQMTGAMSPENRAELKKEIEALKVRTNYISD